MSALERTLWPTHSRQLIDDAWKQSGEVYGYRRLHDDLLDQVEIRCASRTADLARLAQIEYRRGLAVPLC